MQKNNPLALLFEDCIWNTKLAYLADVLGLLSDINMIPRGKSGNIFKHIEYIECFQKMMNVWQGRHKNDHTTYYMFPTLLLQTVENAVDDDILIELKLETLSDLIILSEGINNYFPEEKFEPVKKSLWLKNAVTFKSPESIIELSLLPKEETELQHLSYSFLPKNHFESLQLCLYWAKNKGKNPPLSKKAILSYNYLPV